MDDTQTSLPSRTARLPALDVLRGAAILAVFLHHAAPGTPPTGPLRFVLGAAHLGWFGVDLFFVLSGFLITGILLDTRDDAHYFRRFYARRFRRIFPVYYLALAVMILALPLLGARVADAARAVASHQAWYWTYASNLRIAATGEWGAGYADHFWTLAVEEQFYIIWPLVVLASTPRGLARTCVLIAIGALVLRLALIFSGVTTLSVSVFTLTRADSLALGALPACLVRLPDGEQVVRRLIPRAAVVGGAVAIAIALADIAGFVGSWWMGEGAAWATVGYSALAAAFSAVVAAAALGMRVSGSGHAFGFLRRTGTYSYALYVVHAPVLYILHDLGPKPTYWAGHVAYAGLGFVLAYGLAAASWHWLESRILTTRGSAPSAPDRPAAAVG